MSTVRLRQGLSFTRTDYGGVILDRRRGDYWRLNPVGAEVFATWISDSGADPVAAVVEQFDVDVATARRDITEMLQRLRGLGLVVG